jgi:cell filamentation protein
MTFSADPYCYPGTAVLINQGGFRLQTELDQFEADAFLLASAKLRTNPIPGKFEIHRLLETHRRLFSRVYPWAGELRKDTGALTKAREWGQIVTYGPSVHLPATLDAAFGELKQDRRLQGLDADDLARQLA